MGRSGRFLLKGRGQIIGHGLEWELKDYDARVKVVVIVKGKKKGDDDDDGVYKILCMLLLSLLLLLLYGRGAGKERESAAIVGLLDGWMDGWMMMAEERGEE